MSGSMRRRAWSIAGAVGLLLAETIAAGCSATRPGPPATPPAGTRPAEPTASPGTPRGTIENTVWAVDSVAGRAIGDPGATEIRFSANGTVSGGTGCNRFTGRFTIAGEAISFSPLVSTRRACPPPLMEQESRILDAMGAARAVARAGADRLRLLDADGRTRLVLRHAVP